MRVRHAAAFALVGWYLLTPPMSPDAKKIDSDQPLSKWNHSASFDLAKECEATRINLYQSAMKDLPKKSGDPLGGLMLIAEMSAECIQADDPRLKQN
jgi:hypothetical protein